MLSRDSDIINMFLGGYSVKDIADNFSCSEEYALDKIIRYRASRIIKYTKDLENEEEVVGAIGEYIKENIEKVKDRSRDERRKINGIINLSEEGMTLDNIANVFSLTRERIRQIITNYAPELVIVKNDNRYKLCESCGEKKRGVFNRHTYGLICSDCYEQIKSENKGRWSKKYDKCVDCGTTNNPHRIKGRCSKCYLKYSYYYDLNRRKSIKKSGEKWRKKNMEKVRETNRRASIKQLDKRLNGNRSKALKRDGFKCVDCGLSLEDSLKKYSRSLYVSHLNNQNNHNLANLITLCPACHNSRYRRGKSKE